MTEATGIGEGVQIHKENETQPKTELSVNGSQLLGLAFTDEVSLAYRRHLFDRDRGSKIKPLLRRLPGQSLAAKVDKKTEALRQAILDDNKEAAIKLGEELTVPDDHSVQKLIGALEQDVSLSDVLKKHADHEFLQSLTLPVRRDKPRDNTAIVLPDLGVHAFVEPDKNNLLLSVDIHDDSRLTGVPVSLALDQQSLAWVAEEAVQGTKEEALSSQLDVFGALSAQTDAVYTHMTYNIYLPGILSSESFGTSQLRGHRAIAHGLKGLFVEKGQLGTPKSYDDAKSKVMLGDKPTLPVKIYEGESVISSGYVEPGNSHQAIILLDQEVAKHRESTGTGFVGSFRHDDQDIIGYLVTPTVRKNLLTWINTWPEEKKTRIFGNRTPESLLIASAKDLPEKYKTNASGDQKS
jgi:hypothetical protein